MTVTVLCVNFPIVTPISKDLLTSAVFSSAAMLALRLNVSSQLRQHMHVYRTDVIVTEVSVRPSIVITSLLCQWFRVTSLCYWEGICSSLLVVMTIKESRGVVNCRFRNHWNINICVCLDLWHGLRNGDQASTEPRTSNFTLTPALWPTSLLHLEGLWASSCRIWTTSLPSWQAKWVQRSSRGRESGSYTAWNWQREYKNFAKVKCGLFIWFFSTMPLRFYIVSCINFYLFISNYFTRDNCSKAESFNWINHCYRINDI